MADVHSKATRSYNMGRIKAKNTGPEMLVRSFLHAQGYRYRLHDKKLPGKPDIILPKYKTLLFINGCFWHGHANCKYYKEPQTRTDWWLTKINGNIARDAHAQAALLHAGWRVIVIWECDLKPQKQQATLQQLVKNILAPNS